MRAIYYDTETTGTRPDSDRVVEIAAYDPVNDLSFDKLVNPGIPIPAEASAVHKISDDMVADQPDFGVIGREFVEFCSGDVVLIAHNNDGFDVHFLRNEFARHEIPFPDWKFIDTLKWSRKYRKDLPKHALQFLREMYGIEENNAHRALDDVKVLYQLFSRMIDDLPIETVYDLLNNPANQKPEEPMTHMPFGKHQGKPLEEVPKNYVEWLSKDGALSKPENQALKEGFQKAGML